MSRVLPVLIGTMFLFGSAAKVNRWSAFRAAVRGYRLIPEWLNGVVCGLILVIEFLVGAGLALTTGGLMPSFTAIVLLVVFSSAVALTLARGRRDLTCGCMVLGNQTIGWHVVFRNVFLIACLAPQLLPQFLGLWLLTGCLAMSLFLVSARAREAPRAHTPTQPDTLGCAECAKKDTAIPYRT